MHDNTDRNSVLKTLQKTVGDAKHLAAVAKAPFLTYLLEMVNMGIDEEINGTAVAHDNDGPWKGRVDPRIG